MKKKKNHRNTNYWYGVILLLSCAFLFNFHWIYEPKKITINSISKVKKEQYQRDATRLALRLLSKTKEYQDIEVEVSYELVNSIYDALIAVHSSDLEEAKLVTDLHKLHAFPSPAVDNFLVVYRRNAKWANPLRLGDCSTENEQINELCHQYGLVINNNIQWDDEHNSFNVRSSQALNLTPVADIFSTIDGIKKVDMLTPSGDGNDIEIVQIDTGWEISYIVKFDACFSTCRKQRRWTFQVGNTGQVKFLEESGHELPAWMKKSRK